MKNIILKISLLIFLFLLMGSFISIELHAQVEEDLIEELTGDDEDEDIDYTTLLENLTYYEQNPVDLNTVTKEELEEFGLLNNIQISNFLYYRRKYGNIYSVYELNSINGFDSKLVKVLLNYVTVNPTEKKTYPFKIKNMFKYSRNEVFVRYQQVIEEQAGYSDIEDSLLAENPNQRYMGNAAKYYARYRFRYQKTVSAGITAEKDPGEAFFTEDQKNGFDYYSGHVFLRDIGVVKQLAIGDFHTQFGQGLTLWSGLSFGKSSDALNVMKFGQALRPYTSVDENRFMRGVGTTIQYGKFDFTAFYSSKKVDANISAIDTISDAIEEITSLQSTGYHRTYNELADKDAIQETYYGGNVTYRNNKLKLGFTGYTTQLGAELNKNLSPYNMYDFVGKENFNLGMDYNYLFHHVSVFGEIATCQNGRFAYINGLTTELAPFISIAIIHRKYAKDYQNLNSSAFGVSSSNQNEDGLFTGIVLHPIKNWTLSGYFDSWEHAWMRFRTYAPSNGYDYHVQLDHNPSRYWGLYFRVKHKFHYYNGEINEPDIRPLQGIDKSTYRFNIDYHVTKSIRMRNRLEIVHYDKEGEETSKGFMLYHDIAYRPDEKPIDISARIVLFDTDTYDSRIYAYENDVLYAFSIPAYYYKGMRYYLVLKYEISRNAAFWLKYSQTIYTDKNIISSGLNEINDNHKSEIKAQLRIKF